MSNGQFKINGFDFDFDRANLPASKLELFLVSKAIVNYVLALQVETINHSHGKKAHWQAKRIESEKMLEDLLAGLITQGGTKLDEVDDDE